MVLRVIQAAAKPYFDLRIIPTSLHGPASLPPLPQLQSLLRLAWPTANCFLAVLSAMSCLPDAHPRHRPQNCPSRAHVSAPTCCHSSPSNPKQPRALVLTLLESQTTPKNLMKAINPHTHIHTHTLYIHIHKHTHNIHIHSYI